MVSNTFQYQNSALIITSSILCYPEYVSPFFIGWYLVTILLSMTNLMVYPMISRLKKHGTGVNGTGNSPFSTVTTLLIRLAYLSFLVGTLGHIERLYSTRIDLFSQTIKYIHVITALAVSIFFPCMVLRYSSKFKPSSRNVS